MLLVKADPEWKLLHRIADGLRPELQRELFAALDGLKHQIPTASLIDLIENGELSRVLAETKLTLPDLTALTTALTVAVVASANHVTASLTANLEMSFTLINQRAVTWAERYAGQLITEVNRETQQAVSEIVQSGFLEGVAPRVQAIAIEQAVGNHPRDAQATFRFLDGLVQSGMSEKRASEMSATYARRLLRHRAEMIARTETMRASNMGQQLAWEAAADQGLLVESEIRRVWIVTDDDRTCPRCLTLDDEQSELGGTFTEGNKEDWPDVPRRPSKTLKPKVPKKFRIPRKPKEDRTARTPKGFIPQTVKTPPLHVGCRCSMGIVEVNTG